MGDIMANSNVEMRSLRNDMEALQRDMGQLRAGQASIDSNVEEKIAMISKHVQMVSIKSGFLAVAISECEHEEKAQIFSKLKEKESILNSDLLSRSNPSRLLGFPLAY